MIRCDICNRVMSPGLICWGCAEDAATDAASGDDPLSWFRRLIAEATPGPLVCRDGRYVTAQVDAGVWEEVARTATAEPPGQQEANARLFATLVSAAPAVLALLEAADDVRGHAWAGTDERGFIARVPAEDMAALVAALKAFDAELRAVMERDRG